MHSEVSAGEQGAPPSPAAVHAAMQRLTGIDPFAPIFHDERKAREWFESQIWPEAPKCPHCGAVGKGTLLKGRTTRPGLYQCNACHRSFTVTVGTMFAQSHIPLHVWLAAVRAILLTPDLKPQQLRKALRISGSAAWQLVHRIRKALRLAELKSQHPAAPEQPLGSGHMEWQPAEQPAKPPKPPRR